MKRLIALLLTLILALSLCSCVARPNLDLRDAETILKEKNYTVVYVDEDLLSMPEVEYFTAYKGNDALTVTVYATVKSARFEYEEARLERETSIALIEMEIKEAEYTLKKYRDDLSSYEIKELEEDIKDLTEELDELENTVIGRSGKTVWKGTKQALKDSRK